MSSSVHATKVSVIIPHFRRPKTLNQTLCSLLRQTHDLSLIEFIVVDDGSPYNEQPDISYFESRMDIKVLHQSDMGYRLAKARNLGILHATNDTIILLDCDLAVSPQFITRHLDALSGNHRNISIGLRDSRRVDDDLDPFVFEQKHPSEIGTFKKRLETHHTPRSRSKLCELKRCVDALLGRQCCFSTFNVRRCRSLRRKIRILGW